MYIQEIDIEEHIGVFPMLAARGKMKNEDLVEN